MSRQVRIGASSSIRSLGAGQRCLSPSCRTVTREGVISILLRCAFQLLSAIRRPLRPLARDSLRSSRSVVNQMTATSAERLTSFSRCVSTLRSSNKSAILDLFRTGAIAGRTDFWLRCVLELSMVNLTDPPITSAIGCRGPSVPSRAIRYAGGVGRATCHHTATFSRSFGRMLTYRFRTSPVIIGGRIVWADARRGCLSRTAGPCHRCDYLATAP